MSLERRDILRGLLAGGVGISLRGFGQSVAPLTSAVAWATSTVPDLDKAVEIYCKWLGYVVHWRGKVEPALAAFWQAPKVAGNRIAVIGPQDCELGLIRFVEIKTQGKPLRPYSTAGWNVMEIRARNVDELTIQFKGSPFVHIGGPADLSSVNRPPTLRATQFLGIAGEILYFTQSLSDPRTAPWDIPKSVGPLFITVLTAKPYIPTRDFYSGVLGLRLGLEASRAIKVINETIGQPLDRKLTLSALWSGKDTAIEIDDFSDLAAERPVMAGSLPPGVAMCTLTVPDADRVATALTSAGVAFRRFDGGKTIPPYGKLRALICRGRSGELLELVERAVA
jgi:catechol 2,3-dioxygenase-like lactoylglutathione lyase family enzyme